MKKSILDEFNEILFEHDYPEINSLVEFFGVDIRVHSKEEYDYLEQAKKSYIEDIDYFYNKKRTERCRAFRPAYECSLKLQNS